MCGRRPRSLHPVQRLPPRSLPLPVLRRPASPRRTDVRSRPTAGGRWPDVLDEHRGGLQPLQRAQGPFPPQAAAEAVRADAARLDGGPASLPAELSARDLARLSVLGRRAGEVTAPAAGFGRRLPPQSLDSKSSRRNRGFCGNSPSCPALCRASTSLAPQGRRGWPGQARP